MHFFHKNKKFLGIVLALVMMLIPSSQVAAFEEATPYPLIEGSPNSQEIFYNTTPADISGNVAVQFTLGSRIMTLDGAKRFYPNQNLTAAQAIALAVNVSGKQSAVKQDPKDWKKGYIEVAKKDKILTDGELKTAEADNFDAVIDNQTFARWMGKALGQDFIYNQSPTANLTRVQAAEMIHANKEKVIARLQSNGASGQKIIYKGEVISSRRVTDKGIESLVTTVKSDQGGYFDVLSNRDKNFPVSVNGQIYANPGSLNPGAKAEFYMKDGRVYFAIAGNIQHNSVSGTFEGIKGSNIILKDFNNKTMIYTYSPNAQFFTEQNGQGQNMKTKTMAKSDLIYGQDIRLVLKDNVAEEIYALLEIDEDLDGYVPPQSRMVAGKVLDITGSHLTLENNQGFDILPETLVYKEGKLSDITNLKQGDLVKVYMDDIYSQKVAKLDIEGPQRQADTIMKAKISAYAQGNMKISLSNVKELTGNTWQPKGSEYGNMTFSGDLYLGGAKLEKSKLNQFKDQDIYMVVSKNQNNPKIEKANILVGGAISFSEEIETVDPAGAYMSIDGVIANYSKGTIVVKDGRIVDERNIQPKLGAYVEAGSNNNNASLIVMDTVLSQVENGSYGYTIYRGTFENVFTYKFALYNDKRSDGRFESFYYVNKGSKWETLKAGKDEPMIRFSEETHFYDADNKKDIDMEVIKNLRFTDRKNDETKLLERQVYVVVRNGIAIAVNFEKDYQTTSLVNAQNTMIAKVETADADGKKVTLKDVSKYNLLRGIFVPQKDKEEVNLSKAIVIKDGRYLPAKAFGELEGRKVRLVYKQQTTKTNEGIVLIVEN